MQFHGILCIFYFVIFRSINCSPNDNDITFIHDFCKLMEYQAISTYVCWEKCKILKLATLLNNSSISYIVKLQSKFDRNDIHYIKNVSNSIIILDTRCQNVRAFLAQDINSYLKKYKFSWLILGALGNLQSNICFPADKKFFIVETHSASRYVVTSIFQFRCDSKQYMNRIGDWKVSTGFSSFDRISIPYSRANLMGTPITVSFVMVLNESLNHLWDYRERHHDKFTKLNYMFIHYLLENHNATVIDIWADTYGFRNGGFHHFNGMIGHVLNGQADLAGTPFFIASDRIAYFDYVIQTPKENAMFHFLAPSLSSTFNIFYLTFSKGVWLSAIVLMALSTIVFYLLMRQEYQLMNGPKKLTFSDVVLMQISLMAQNGESPVMRGSAAKVAFYFLVMNWLFLYTAFTAHVVVLLQSNDESIHTLRDLYESEMTVGAEDTSYQKYYFAFPTDQAINPYRKLFYENRMLDRNKKPYFLPGYVGIEKVRKGFFAFSMENGAAIASMEQTFSMREKCKVRSVSTVYKIPPLFLATKKNSFHGELFRTGYRRFYESGLYQRIHKRFVTKNLKCEGHQGNYVSVSVNDCYFAFLILIIGYFGSTFILTIEVLVIRAKKRRSATRESERRDLTLYYGRI